MGAILHTINFRLFPEQIAYIANHAEDYILFVDGTLAPTIEPLFASGQLSTIKHYVLLGHQRVQTSLKPCAIFNDLVAAAEPIAAFDEMLPENTALGLCYTSGTTGHPKGVLYSHRSTVLAAFSTQMPELYPLSDRDTLLCIVPMFHGHAWGFPFVCAMNGTDIVLPGRDLSPQHLASLLLSERVTFTCGVPTIWLTMYEHLMKEKAKRGGKLDLSHCRIVTSAFVCPDFVFKGTVIIPRSGITFVVALQITNANSAST
jgi:fatty-acyl-CoA synthase